ncbi:MAG TPA: protein kinase [Gemmatimonadaceae bacterium]|nr:protein kinase [Gemmatimonadaceae bacterium]
MAIALQDRLQHTLGDGYAIESELPPGGMSRLFLATERALDRKVVVKLLPPEFASELNAQRFQREMLVTARLQHPHILPILSAGARDGLLFYVTPYVAGESLRHRLARDGVLPPDETVRLLREVTDALSFAHKHGVIHRDLKPGNILLQHDHVVLADFGIARALQQASPSPSERLTTTGLGIGTPGYMAPEQLVGESDIDARADIYALGVVAYEMLSGDPPFAGLAAGKLFMVQLTENPRHIREASPSTPTDLADLVMRCLEREPADRYSSADEVLRLLDDLLLVEARNARTARVRRGGGEADSVRVGLSALAAGDWSGAFDALSAADTIKELSPEQLDSLADAAWWTGRHNESVRARERAYAGFVERDDRRRAAAAAIHLAEDYAYRLARSVSQGWMQRAERHLAGQPECIEHGWLIRTRLNLAMDDYSIEHAREMAQQTIDIARRLGDRDLSALGLQDMGRILVAEGRVSEGMALIDEAMAAATSGQLDARTTGRAYCNMMSTCEKLGDYRRAREWNEVATQWCEPHSQSGYPGVCRVHRAELLRLRGAWTEAEAEARKASADMRGFLDEVAAEANYEVGEVRLRMGDHEGAEDLFRQAHELGRDPLPGLALLRIEQGRADSARALLERALAEPSIRRLDRARLLPGLVEASILTGHVDKARQAAAELESIAEGFGTSALAASAAMARGAVDLAEGRPTEGASHIRRAWRLWKELDLPYEAARARALLGQAYQALGNEEDAALELHAATMSFERLGAAADARRTAALLSH